MYELSMGQGQSSVLLVNFCPRWSQKSDCMALVLDKKIKQSLFSVCVLCIVCSLHFVLTGFVHIQSYRVELEPCHHEYIVLLG